MSIIPPFQPFSNRGALQGPQFGEEAGFAPWPYWKNINQEQANSSGEMASPPPKDSPSDSPPPPPPSPSTSSNSPPPPSQPLPSSSSPPPPSPPPQSPPPSPTSSSPPPSPPPPTPTSPPPPVSPPPPSKGKGNDTDNNKFSPPPPPPPSTPSPSSSNSAGNRTSLPSPPPPRSVGPPPPKDSHSSSPATITYSNSDISFSHLVPIVVGVAVGVGVLFILALLGCLCTCRKKKKRSPQYDYYPDHFNPGSKAVARGEYYNSTPNGVWQQTGSNHHSPVGIPPPPGGVAGGHGGWSSTSPVGSNNSNDMSSNNFSGPQGPALPPPHPSVALGFTKSSFTYDELAIATSGFSQANLLGQGGFGYVHKGVLPNGKEIAVKSLKAGSGQGDREFQAEVEIISRVHHRHLVSLVGYCIAGGQKLLVYEFVPNNTLEHHLHGKGHPVMEWSNRMKIALGSAKGLAYLHEDCHPRIIHRDIKGANILLDYSFEAKVADFGLAKLSNDTNTHVSTRVMGTFGYLAPEYAASGKLTDKSDVFSFGVMLLELITGRRPIDLASDEDDNLVDWARPLCDRALEDGNYSKLVDPLLEGNYDPQEMVRMVACAGASVRHSARRRPKMSQIVRALEGDLSVEHMKNETTSSQSSMFNSSDYSSNSYNANMKNFRKMALESTDYTSSEFGQTSEYGLNPSSSSSEDMSRAASQELRH